MPKSYSDQERALIVSRLQQEAALCLRQYGIKKTTVDELVRRVKIPKGTFYLFYKSKEILLFEVLLKQHDLIQAELLQKVTAYDGKIDSDQLTDLFFHLYQVIDRSGILKLLTSGEVELLMRRLPPEMVQQHLKHDQSEISELLALLPGLKTTDLEQVTAAFRAVFLTTLFKREIGEKYFDESLKMLLRGLALQLLT